VKFIINLLCLVSLLIFVQACDDSPNSPEDEIRQFIEAGVDAAEERSLDDLAVLVDDNYLDAKAYNKKQLGSLLSVYFFRHRNIHLFTRINEIELLNENQASVRLQVAMAGSEILDVSALSTLRAQIFSFELQLIRQEAWLLQSASWSPASIADFE
jgi:hypothetical protein